MGGTALRQFGVESKRMNLEEYHKLWEQVKKAFDVRFCMNHENEIHLLRTMKDKSDFGDMDVLVDSSMLPNNWADVLKEEFKSAAIYNNGDCVSFDVGGFQLDIIKAARHEFDAAKFYFDDQDKGNLCGKLSRRLGLKLGHDGLSYVFRNGDQVIEEIEVTTDPKTICELLGVSYKDHMNGFDELEDMFEWVAKSPYFDPNVFAFEEMNSIARIRDKKRKTYNLFLKWIADNKDTRNWDFKFNKDKNSYLPMLFVKFPKFRYNWYMTRYKMLDRIEFKRKFNGEIVREVTGLFGKDLGEFMIANRDEFNNDYVMTQSEDAIREKIQTIWSKWA